jgi:predicted glycosyltransferase
VPFADGLEDEQTERARRLEQIGAVRVLDQRQMNPLRLADEIRRLLDFNPQGSAIDLNGAERSAQILMQLFAGGRAERVRSTAAATAQEAHP